MGPRHCLHQAPENDGLEAMCLLQHLSAGHLSNSQGEIWEYPHIPTGIEIQEREGDDYDARYRVPAPWVHDHGLKPVEVIRLEKLI
jgi:hypothetical protein